MRAHLSHNKTERRTEKQPERKHLVGRLKMAIEASVCKTVIRVVVSLSQILLFPFSIIFDAFILLGGHYALP